MSENAETTAGSSQAADPNPDSDALFPRDYRGLIEGYALASDPEDRTQGLLAMAKRPDLNSGSQYAIIEGLFSFDPGDADINRDHQAEVTILAALIENPNTDRKLLNQLAGVVSAHMPNPYQRELHEAIHQRLIQTN